MFKLLSKSRSINYQLFSAVLLLLGAIWIWVSRVPDILANGEPVASPMIGFQAPDFTLQDQTGTLYTLASLRGQAILINFWASWCPPCRAEMPAMQDVYAQYQSQGFIILAVNSTIQDNPKEASAFFQEFGLTFPMLMDRDGSVTHAYRVKSLPTSYFIDPDGKIQDIVIGGPMAEALLISRVERLITPASSSSP